MGIKQRLIFFWMAALTSVLVLFTGVTYFLVRHHLYAQVHDKLNATLQELSHSVRVENGKIEILESEALEDKKNGVRDTYWMVGIDHGPEALIQRVGSSARWRRVGEYHSVSPKRVRIEEIRSDDYLVDQRVQSFPSTTGIPLSVVFTVAYPLEENEHYLIALLAAMSGVSLLTVLGSWSLASWLVTRALDPLTQLARQAEGIGEKELSQRLKLARGAPANDQIAILAEAFNACLARLETAFEQQRRFASSASHELRTPLTVIRGEAEVALRRERPANEYRETIERIDKQSARLLDLIEKLLFLGRSEGFENAIRDQSIPIGELVQEFKERWQSHARAKDVEFQIAPEVEVLSLKAQRALLNVVLDNLMDNAAKFSAAGTPIRVSISKSQPAELNIFFADSGPGIPPNELPRIFEPFYRGTQAEQGTVGAGLGLAMAQRIATLHGGSLKLYSPVGDDTKTGTRAEFRLPIAQS